HRSINVILRRKSSHAEQSQQHRSLRGEWIAFYGALQKCIFCYCACDRRSANYVFLSPETRYCQFRMASSAPAEAQDQM
ncbi:MAG: hypothetical protein WAK39_08845, partial [Pseudolabrys sp.]